MDEFKITDVFEKDPEELTAEDRKKLMAHHREERDKFDKLDKAGKSVRKKAPKGTKGKPSPAKDASDDEILGVKIL